MILIDKVNHLLDEFFELYSRLAIELFYSQGLHVLDIYDHIVYLKFNIILKLIMKLKIWKLIL